MKKLLFSILALLFFFNAFTQTGKLITLEECYQLAIAAHPLGQKSRLLEEATVLRQEQIDIRKLPNITLNAQARLQSENVKVPFEIPGQSPIELPLFVSQATVDADYLLLDGGVLDARRQIEEAELLAEKQGVTTELARLKARVNQLYFGILLRRSQTDILQASLANLEARVRQAEAAVRHGTLLESELSKLRVEVLRLQSQIDQAEGDTQALLATLGQYIGDPLPADTELQLPALEAFSLTPALEREELIQFELQKQRIMANEQLITAERRPRLSVFAQAGLGYPNPLNFFDETISPFALVGVRFNWKIFDWNKTAVDRQLLGVQSRMVDNRRQVFEYEIELQEEQFREEIATLERLIERDESIVELQREILQQTGAQLDRGVITPAEYLEEVSAATRAQLNLQNHRLRLRQAKVDYLTQKGLR